ncbi:DUF1127 domain-containing protein [Fontisubflavum oceani]|uniref:DUF1127 domain-containing protein n=1 Tax=Fontisubflavum oceani TaxID=2978973 RepID=UPI0025B4E792|nr:DUF1127 domain-containing protein [Fontisubflavum oceani]WJY21621.1 DUF1127 domain-containing protein [Fontisubflavum oceani]
MAHTVAHHRALPARQAGLFQLISTAFAVWRQRRALAALDANARRDLGLSNEEISIETARPIWDVPQTWRY